MRELNDMHDGASPEIFDRARVLRNNLTIPEQILWSILKNNEYKFRRQHPIRVFILDFYCHSKRLSIEIDGKSHQREERVAVDKIKSEYLKSVGIVELRFTNEEVLNNVEGVVSRIQAFIDFE